MSKMILCENFENLEVSSVLNESTGKTFNVLEGMIQEADTKNKNGRIYPRSALMPAIDDYMSRHSALNWKGAVGELDHPEERVTLEFEKVCHRLLDIWWKGNKVFGKFEILTEFPSGEILEKARLSGIPIGTSSRSVGSLERRGRNLFVEDDLKIICWDAVVDPSVAGCYLRKGQDSLSESHISPEPIRKIESIDLFDILREDLW